MCGIAGFIDKEDTITQEERGRVIKKMLRLMKHRGGNAEGIKSLKNVSVGHTRLSIIDVSSLGNQPSSDEHNDFILSFNGEIYNHRSLRSKHLSRAQISSGSDTATLFELLKRFP